MFEENTAAAALTGIPDLELFKETALRLSKQYEDQHKTPFLYGSFDFVFHKGVLRCIEERPRNKRYFEEDELPLSIFQREKKGKR